MSANAWTVVKVGGSLYDLPDLRDRLRGFLAPLRGKILLVPGGGAAADAIRAFDRVHQLGEEASHWLAIRALSLNARFLATLLPEARILANTQADASGSGVFVIDAHPFFEADERQPGHLPHLWKVTSDSLAVRAATVLGARELILLKSIDWPGDNWQDAARRGIVDGYFTAALEQASPSLIVRVVNLRQASPATR
jgi:aspartokinase-like uncharacterized kinase